MRNKVAFPLIVILVIITTFWFLKPGSIIPVLEAENIALNQAVVDGFHNPKIWDGLFKSELHDTFSEAHGKDIKVWRIYIDSTDNPRKNAPSVIYEISAYDGTIIKKTIP